MVTTTENGTAERNAEKSSETMVKKDKSSKSAKANGAEKKGGDAAERIMASNPHLKTAMQQIEKQFGEGSIMALGDDQLKQIEGVPTGSLSLDLALGGQGVPRGRIIEVFGPGVEWQDDLGAACGGRSQKDGRDCRHH